MSMMDFDSHFSRASKRIDRTQKAMGVLAVLAGIVWLAFAGGTGFALYLGIKWLWQHTR